MCASSKYVPLPPGATEIKRRGTESIRVNIDGLTFVARFTRCNKPNCRACPHGPYWHRVIKTPKREIEKYIGRDLIPWLARRWLMQQQAEHDQLRLPGMDAIFPAVSEVKPAWLPDSIHEALRNMKDGERLSNDKIELLLRGGGQGG